MKTRTLIAMIYSLTVAVIAVCLVLEHRACAQIYQENKALLRRLNEATEKLAENQRWPGRAALSTDPVSDASGAPASAALTGADEELAWARSELAGVLEHHNQAESLRADTLQTRAALENRKKEDRAARRAANSTPSQLEIVKAEYWTENTRMDVTDELQDRIRGHKLKAMASNNIKGDPEFGQVKHLTIEYRFGGVTRTNEFQEGDVIVLPAEP
jgi:hypothetical protein